MNQEGLLNFIKCLFDIQYMMKCFCVAIDMTHHSNIYFQWWLNHAGIPEVIPTWFIVDMLNMFFTCAMFNIYDCYIKTFEIGL